MPRVQFKLRTLLIALSLACSALGLYHFYWQPRIAVEWRGADRISVRWRLLCFSDQDSLPCEITILRRNGGREIVYKQTIGVADKRGWARYLGKVDLSLRAAPGDYSVVIVGGTSNLQVTLTAPSR